MQAQSSLCTLVVLIPLFKYLPEAMGLMHMCATTSKRTRTHVRVSRVHMCAAHSKNTWQLKEKAEVKAPGGSRCCAPRCRVHTRPSSLHQEDGDEACQRRLAKACQRRQRELVGKDSFVRQGVEPDKDSRSLPGDS